MMKKYRYSAEDHANRQHAGELAAASADQARRELESRGFRVKTLEPITTDPQADPTADPPGVPAANGGLRARPGEEPLSAIADMAQAGLPLSSGFLALCEEAPTRRLRRVLLGIGKRLESGEPLASILKERPRGEPPEVRCVIEAGLETGRLGLLVDKYLRLARDARELSSRMWFSLAYAAIVLVAAFLLCGAMLVWIVPQFESLFDAFGVELPVLTKLVLAVSNLLVDYGLIIPAGIAGLALVAGLVSAVCVSRARRQRLLEAIPLFGPRMRYASLARFCRFLALLIDCRLELPAALRVAGHSTGNANLVEGCERLAAQVEAGQPLEGAAADLPSFPQEVRGLFRWAEHETAFSTALEAAGKLFAARSITQTGLVAIICEPLLFGGIAVVIGGIVVAVIWPLIRLMVDLS